MWVLGSLQGCLPCCASAQPLEKWGLLQSCEGTRMRRVPPPPTPVLSQPLPWGLSRAWELRSVGAQVSLPP